MGKIKTKQDFGQFGGALQADPLAMLIGGKTQHSTTFLKRWRLASREWKATIETRVKAPLIRQHGRLLATF